MSRIASVSAIPARFERPEAYLGSQDVPDEAGAYFLRPHLRAVYSRYFESMFVRIVTDDGAEGWGECLAPVAPRVSAAVVDDLLTDRLIGRDPHSVEKIRSDLYDLMRDRGYFGGFYVDALTAVDIALWDLKGKLLGLPVVSLLGGPYREDVPAYVSAIGGVSDAEKRACIADWRDAGFINFKHHGGRGAESDVATMAAIVEAAGSGSTIGLDGHWAYSRSEAAKMAEPLEELGVSFFEAPLNPEDVAGHAHLASQVRISIAIGECLRTRYEYLPWFERRAVGIAQPDVGRSGITETIAIASMAEAFGVQVAPHLSVGLGPMIAASIHVAAALPNLYLLEYQPPTVELANSLLDADIRAREGRFEIPAGPGLGVSMSDSRIAEMQA